MRQTLAAAFLGFVAGFLAVLVGVGYLLVRHVFPDARWWSVAFEALRLLLLSVIGGVWVAVAATYLTTRLQYRWGMHRCSWCGLPLRAADIPCECLADELRRPASRRHPWRHYRRRLGFVLLLYLAIVPLVILFMAASPHQRGSPLERFATGHALLTGAVLVLAELLETTLELAGRGRRLRLRLTVFKRVAILWPLAFLVGTVVVKLLGG